MFLFFGAAACFMMIFGQTLVGFFLGVPFVHLLLAVGAIPLDMMAIGLAVRGWMIFYRFPAKLHRETTKVVYVNLVENPGK